MLGRFGYLIKCLLQGTDSDYWAVVKTIGYSQLP